MKDPTHGLVIKTRCHFLILCNLVFVLNVADYYVIENKAKAFSIGVGEGAGVWPSG